jgi:hypothetical protein
MGRQCKVEMDWMVLAHEMSGQLSFIFILLFFIFSFKACDSFICGFTAWIFAFQSCFLLGSAAQNT